MELLVELWESEEASVAHHGGQPPVGCQAHIDGGSGAADCCQSSTAGNCYCSEAEGNLSPGAVGHRFLGLCLVSVQDLMATLSQNHVVSLQGRPFLDDSVLNWTITLKVSIYFMPPSSKGMNKIQIDIWYHF